MKRNEGMIVAVKRNLCNCVKKPATIIPSFRAFHCDDHSFISFHISLTLISFTGTYEPTIDLLPTSLAS